jgi:hypothetical protein
VVVDINHWVCCLIHYLTLVVGLSYGFYFLVFNYSLDYEPKFSYSVQIIADEVIET